VFLEKEVSLEGTSGGLGALGDLCPIAASFPVRKRCTACRVRSTYYFVFQTINFHEDMFNGPSMLGLECSKSAPPSA